MKTFMYRAAKAIYRVSCFVAGLMFLAAISPAVFVLITTGKLCGCSNGTIRKDIEAYVRFRDEDG